MDIARRHGKADCSVRNSRIGPVKGIGIQGHTVRSRQDSPISIRHIHCDCYSIIGYRHRPARTFRRVGCRSHMDLRRIGSHRQIHRADGGQIVPLVRIRICLWPHDQPNLGVFARYGMGKPLVYICPRRGRSGGRQPPGTVRGNKQGPHQPGIRAQSGQSGGKLRPVGHCHGVRAIGRYGKLLT